MASSQLPNYLRAHRKRMALSQREIAFLLGVEYGTKVCRYECFSREPRFRTILAMEAIFQCPAHQIFAGVFRQIERDVAARAKVLLKRLKNPKSNQRVARKRQILERLAAGPTQAS